MELIRGEAAFFPHSFPHLPRLSMIDWRAVDGPEGSPFKL